MMTERELYDGVIVEGTTDLFFVTDLLTRRGAGWCLIGGLAINAYVSPVYTAGCDLIVVSADLGPVLDELRSAGFRIKEFAFSINAQRRLKPGERSTHRLMVQFTKPEKYQAFTDRATLRTVFGREMPVAALPDLVQGKLWAWGDVTRRNSKRMKDAFDLVRLAEDYPDIVEPLLPSGLRADSEANRKKIASTEDEDGMGEEDELGR